MMAGQQQPPDWDALARSEAFRKLVAAKARFLVPASAFFIIYYFALPVLVGYFPEAMKKRVWGTVNWGYLFALSQFFMAWALAWLYLRKAAEWDRQAREVVKDEAVE
jgi:uncharacterized membrane protein (DUF485 family)